MKTLARPQVKSTIAISSIRTRKNSLRDCNSNNFKLKNIFFGSKIVIISFSLLVFLLVPDSPELDSKICNKYNAQSVCNIW
tara:strand:- start:69 stop:311 length:243 start_codon:yes stop_codon:yes gene_type:complete